MMGPLLSTADSLGRIPAGRMSVCWRLYVRATLETCRQYDGLLCSWCGKGEGQGNGTFRLFGMLGGGVTVRCDDLLRLRWGQQCDGLVHLARRQLYNWGVWGGDSAWCDGVIGGRPDPWSPVAVPGGPAAELCLHPSSPAAPRRQLYNTLTI